jgi:hypothetical protein
VDTLRQGHIGPALPTLLTSIVYGVFF